MSSAGSGGDCSPLDPTHYVGTESLHTADGVEAGIGNTGGFSCVTCHQLEMEPEHTKTSSSRSAATYTRTPS